MSELLQDIELDDSIKEQLSERFNQTLEARLEEETRGLKSKVDELLGEKKRVHGSRLAWRLKRRPKPRTTTSSSLRRVVKRITSSALKSIK